MTILGIGVDVVHIRRITSILQRRSPLRFVSRILSPEERIHWQCLPSNDFIRKTRFLAVRWSVKESAYKALYPTIRPTWKELTFRGLGDQGEKPVLEYNPASKGMSLGNIHVSVSHDGEYVFTSVVVEST